MTVKHNDHGGEQTITKADWERLQASGHSSNFTVLSDTDFTPAELDLSLPKTGKKSAEKSE